MTPRPAPAVIPPGARAVVRALPRRPPASAATDYWFVYELWIVDARAWSGPYQHHDAIAALVRERYTRSRANGMLAQARGKTRGVLRAGRWVGGVPPWPGLPAGSRSS